MLRWLAFLLALSGAVSAASVNLAWDPVTDGRLTGYELGWGSAAGAYSQYQSATGTTATLDLAEPGPWHVAVRSLGDDAGESLQSGWSNEVLWQATQVTRPLDQFGLWARYEVQTPMAITATLITSDHTTANASSFDTASVSPTSNNLLLLAVNVDFESSWASASWPSVTPSGLGLTWTEVGRYYFYPDTAKFYNSIHVFRAVGAVTPGTITIAFGQAADAVAWDLIEFANTDTGGTNGANAIVQYDGAVTALGATSSSVTLDAFSSANNATFGFIGAVPSGLVGSFSPGSGFTELADHGLNLAANNIIFRADNSTTVSATHNATTSEDRAAIIGIEIKAAESVAASVVPILMRQYAARWK